MTQPNGPILFNYAGGNDSTCSGLGPATPISGINGATTGGVASTTIQLTNSPDLSGVQVGDMLWVNNGSSTRNFSVINAVDNTAKTVTVDDSFTISAGGVNYGIGGKRKRLDFGFLSLRHIGVDAKPGWIIELEDDATFAHVNGLNISSSGDMTTYGPVILRGKSGARRKITQTVDGRALTVNGNAYHWRIENLKFENSYGVGKTSLSSGIYQTQSFGHIQIRNCVFGDPTNTLYSAWYRTGGTQYPNWVNCEFQHCTYSAMYSGVQITDTPGNFTVLGCHFHNNQNNIDVGADTNYRIMYSVFDGGGSGVYLNASIGGYQLLLLNNVFRNWTAAAVDLANADNTRGLIALNNIFAGSGSSVVWRGNATQTPAYVDYNAYYNVGTKFDVVAGLRKYLEGRNDIDLTADPFTDAANDDYSLNDTAGGGAALKGTGYPGFHPQDISALEVQQV